MQKIKPKVEEVCRELGLQYSTEDNSGRIYVNLQGGEAIPPSHGGGGGGHQDQEYRPPHGGYGNQDGGYQPHEPHHQHPPQQEDEMDDGLVPFLLRKLEKACCAVM